MVTLNAVSIRAFTSWNICASALGEMPRCYNILCVVFRAGRTTQNGLVARLGSGKVDVGSDSAVDICTVRSTYCRIGAASTVQTSIFDRGGVGMVWYCADCHMVLQSTDV